MASAISVLQFSHVGSTLSLRGFMRLGSSLSVVTSAGWQTSLTTCPLSVIGATTLGSSLSLRSFGRLGSAVSVFGAAKLGSSLALRSFSRLGSAISLFSVATLGSSMSVFDSCALGSSLPARSFAQPGSGLAVYGGATLKVGTPNINSIQFDTNTYVKYVEGANDYLQFWSNGFRAIDMEIVATPATTDPKRLHGTWTYPSSGTVNSDRRLKTEITPLRRTLQGMQTQGEIATGQKKKGDGALWMLRQLRPVSYSFKAGSESKYMRFGFIADELETTVPQLVRSGGTEQGLENAKKVQMFDLIALLTAAGQSQQEVIENQERLMDQVESEFEAFKAELKLLKELKEKKRQANRALACGATRKKRRRLWWR